VRLLLLSNSTQFGRKYLEHAETEVRAHFEGVTEVLFVPFALADHAAYTQKVADRFADWGMRVRGLHEASDPVASVRAAEAVFVGGGNTFRLLKAMQDRGLLDVLRRRVHAGMPYLGASAGTNLTCPTIRTTNDMPIVEPAGFDSLGVLPVQINPHYLDPPVGSEHMGETRETRLREFLEENRFTVVGLREGSWLRRREDRLELGGERAARIFRPGAAPEEVDAPADLSGLLRER
jgi:dipeptidase E